MIKGLEQHSTLCGVPGDVIKQVKAQHAQAEKIRQSRFATPPREVRRPAGPSLSDALGTTPDDPGCGRGQERRRHLRHADG